MKKKEQKKNKKRRRKRTEKEIETSQEKKKLNRKVLFNEQPNNLLNVNHIVITSVYEANFCIPLNL